MLHHDQHPEALLAEPTFELIETASWRYCRSFSFQTVDVLVGSADRWGAPGEDGLYHAGACEMGVE
jgi:hypothetical protein